MILQSLTWWKSGRFTHRVLRIYWFWQPTLQRRPHQHFGHTYLQALAPHRLKFKSQSLRFCWCHTILGCTISRVITHRMWSQAKISTSFSHQITFASSRCSFKICGLFHNTRQDIIIRSVESTAIQALQLGWICRSFGSVSESSNVVALEWRFGQPDSVKSILERRLEQLCGTKLAL